jgi:serine/threonine protein kinase
MTKYLHAIQTGFCVELYTVIKNNAMIVTKRSKILENGFVCPRFLREIMILKKLTHPPKNLANHPGREHVIKLLDVYVEDQYLHFDMECADGTLRGLLDTHDVYKIKEQILIDISMGLQYVHAMGINHGDLSTGNIVYFEQDNGLPKFVLIDFGNSYYPDRPFTLELSTHNTIPREIITAHKIIRNFEQSIEKIDTLRVQFPDVEKNIMAHMVHKKSDIWSLGALSYYLHTYGFYADGNSLETQERCIDERNVEYISFPGNKEFTVKTRMMVIGDYSFRPVTYYGTVYGNERNEIKNEKISSIDNKIYHAAIEALIESMAVTHKKYYFLNVVDQKMKDMISRQAYDIEMAIIRKIMTRMDHGNVGLYGISRSNIILITRVLIIWIISHQYMNHVWPTQDVIGYVKKQYMVNGNLDNMYNVIKNISLLIFEKL